MRDWGIWGLSISTLGIDTFYNLGDFAHKYLWNQSLSLATHVTR